LFALGTVWVKDWLSHVGKGFSEVNGLIKNIFPQVDGVVTAIKNEKRRKSQERNE